VESTSNTSDFEEGGINEMRVAILFLLLSALAVGQAPKPKAKCKIRASTYTQAWWDLIGGVSALGENEWNPNTLHFFPSGVNEDVEMMRHAKPGDCFRVSTDRTLEKVVACGNTLEDLPGDMFLAGPRIDPGIDYDGIDHSGIIHGIEPDSSITVVKMIDVPAEMVQKPDDLCRLKPYAKPDEFVGCVEWDVTNVPTCHDPDRILIGPDGHNQYWCHLPQL
jgi:hypothetical protein